MREILFRGKRADNGQLVYGVPVIGITSGVFMVWIESKTKRGCGEVSIRDVVKQAEIIPETVGQYTGLDDKNGVKIFEGDVVECISTWDKANMVVIFEDGEYRLVLCDKYKNYTTGSGYYSIGCFDKKVIGNIYDNPELMGETK